MRAGPDLRSGFLRPAPAVPAAVKFGREVRGRMPPSACRCKSDGCAHPFPEDAVPAI